MILTASSFIFSMSLPSTQEATLQATYSEKLRTNNPAISDEEIKEQLRAHDSSIIAREKALSNLELQHQLRTEENSQARKTGYAASGAGASPESSCTVQ